MDAVIVGLVGLTGLFVIADQEKKKNNIETFQSNNTEETINTLNDIPENYPIEKTIKSSINKYDNPNQATDKYYNQKKLPCNDEIDTSFYSLAGNNIDTVDFKHNNMVPYFGAKIRGHSGSAQEQSILDNMVGAGSETINKQEQAPMFKPEDNMQWAHGMPNHTDFYRERQYKGKVINNIKPWDSQQVGPGLNNGYNTAGTDGFNSGMTSRDTWMPKNVDELRVETNPKQTYNLYGYEGPLRNSIQNRGEIGKTMKNLPDTYFLNDPDRYFTTTGIEKKQTLQPLQEMPVVNRSTTSTEYTGNAMSGIYKSKANEIYEPLAKNNHSYGCVTGPISTQQKEATTGDYGIDGYNLNINNRNTTSQPPLMGVNRIINSITAPVINSLRHTRKENVIGNIRENGNIQQRVPGEYVVNVHDTPKTTNKEMLIDKENHLNIQNQGAGAYKLMNPNLLLTNRNTTSNIDINHGGAPYGIKQQDLYVKNQRNNNNKQQSSYIPTGVNPTYNNNINLNIGTVRGKLNDNRECIPSLPNQGPNMKIHGEIHGPQCYDQCINDNRLDADMLNAFKNNPYTQSLNSCA